MHRLISVIVPVYNCEKYIRRLVESILNQSYGNFELILVNDGSKDNTLAILKDFKDRRVQIISKENSGVSDTRNVGFNKSKGELICFLDADDYIDQGFFQEIIEIFDRYPELDLLNFGFYSDVEDLQLQQLSSDKIAYKDVLYSSHNEIKEDFVNLWDSAMLYNPCNKVYLSSIIRENNLKYPSFNYGEDVQFNRDYLMHVKKFYNSSKAFYHYIREREGAVTNTYNPKFFDIRKKEFTEFNAYFELWEIEKEKYYEFSCRRYIERILGCIENVYCSSMSFKKRYKEIHSIIHNNITREALKYAKPKSLKTKILLVPIKLKLTLMTMLMGKTFHFVKTKFPGMFNRLKNKR